MWAIRYINQIKEFHIFPSPVSCSFHNFIIWKRLPSWSLRLFSRNLIWVSIFVCTDWRVLNLFKNFFYYKQRSICFPVFKHITLFLFWMDQFTRLLVFWDHLSKEDCSTIRLLPSTQIVEQELREFWGVNKASLVEGNELEIRRFIFEF